MLSDGVSNLNYVLAWPAITPLPNFIP
uniref:Uncharacterized protein n=1 Tax=Anguilla anguilla TaxID=7936 RepID=A0A0E9P6S8_ANGAN